METYTSEELTKALKVVSSNLSKCEKMQIKFKKGTSQHTLLKNRIKALEISKSLIENGDSINKYSKEDLLEATRPILSIISKCEKAQSKFDAGTANYNRFNDLIKTMYISKSLITDGISKECL